jgi:hypothetical protein
MTEVRTSKQDNGPGAQGRDVSSPDGGKTSLKPDLRNEAKRRFPDDETIYTAAAIQHAFVQGVQFASAWQPIETAPFGKTVLLAWRDWRDATWCYEVAPAEWGWRRAEVSNISKHGSATHWMPLPEPPKP